MTVAQAVPLHERRQFLVAHDQSEIATRTRQRIRYRANQGWHGSRISDVALSRLLVTPQQPITIRLGVKPDAEHQGGFNLFGRGFGNYAQDLVLRLHYVPKKGQERHGDNIAASAGNRK